MIGRRGLVCAMALMLSGCSVQPQVDPCMKTLADDGALIDAQEKDTERLAGECRQTLSEANCDVTNLVDIPKRCAQIAINPTGPCKQYEEARDTLKHHLDQGPLIEMAANSCEQTRIAQKAQVQAAVSRAFAPGSSPWNPVYVHAQ